MFSSFSRLFLKAFLVVASCAMLSSCATYYQKNIKFQEAFAAGDLKKAERILDGEKKPEEGRNRLLYFLQKGVVLQLMGEYEASNVFFEKAYIYIEDYQKNYGAEALALISNPMVKPYPGEDHEKVLIHYYKALNFLMMGDPEGARVEARRINNKLNRMNDKYEKKPNRYKDDAFAHIILGLAYEMDGDVNNAFIAYRNSYESYKNNYQSDFGVSAPLQLKEDVLRTAYLNGFIDELQRYEREFGFEYTHNPTRSPSLVFFWHNGLGPVKGENSINFTVVKGDGGIVTFNNDELGLSFPFPIPNNSEGGDGLGDLKFVRVAFPMYHPRPTFYNSATLEADSVYYPLQEVENVEAIAMSVLQDRMLRELGTALLRLATKQAAEEAMRKENEDLGALVSILNAATEKADTRNWQTLPHTISYARIPLKVGPNQVKLLGMYEGGEPTETTFEYDAEPNKTLFQIYHSLETLYVPALQQYP